jgi:predicted membrane protein
MTGDRGDTTMAPMRSYVELPEGWRRVADDGPGPFVTHELLEAPDGRVLRWRSRRHRKARANGERRGVWWRPDRIGWWMGVLFAIGSACFAIAAIASQWASAPRPAIGVTFFVGSLFFTTAAGLQFHEAINVERGPEHLSRAAFRRWWSWEPKRIDWLAAAIQLVGTVFFNVNTFAGMQDGLNARQELLRVWTPDVVGSICFLVASELAYAEVCNAWVCFKNRTLSWWIVALNMLGSIAFGVSAVTSLIVPSTHEPVSAAIANATTALGAVCFLIGGVLLLPEEAEREKVPA